MDRRLKEMYEQTRSGWYRKFRTGEVDRARIAENYRELPPFAAASRTFEELLAAETPVIVPGEKFLFTRTRAGKTHPPYELGRRIENLTPDWELLLRDGLAGRLAVARGRLEDPSTPPEQREFLAAAAAMLETVRRFALRYAEAAAAAGESACAARMRDFTCRPPETLHEALQAIFFVFSMLHYTGCTLQGFGRMDQYLRPIYERELASGALTREQAGELLAEFFIMLNRENDIYGMAQKGDDGESLMLGGCDRDGRDAVNDLTLLILEVAAEVSMINPKINLRLDRRTPESILRAGLKLAAKGLGFPQYSNDEVVIPALTAFGYPPADARDYTVAACWEFVVKGGRDIPNYASANLALAADRAIRSALRDGADFPELLRRVRPEIEKQLPPLLPKLLPNPLFSAFSGECLERGRDLHDGGGDHYHFGMHGCASSTAADALAAVKVLVYDRKEVAPARLLAALENDFADDEPLRQLLRTAPKTGNADPVSTGMLKFVFTEFAAALEAVRPDARGGRIRPGTGAAQNYVMMTRRKEHPLYLRATADGRKEGEFFSSSLAPAPGVRANGVLSIFRTYGQLPYSRLCNGGPITLELAPAYFRNADALGKGAQLLRAFVAAGCQQLQMNVLDREKLLDAQKHPENHRDLVVRVWGWSGYFVELDKDFQDQIIGREAYGA